MFHTMEIVKVQEGVPSMFQACFRRVSGMVTRLKFLSFERNLYKNTTHEYEKQSSKCYSAFQACFRRVSGIPPCRYGTSFRHVPGMTKMLKLKNEACSRLYQARSRRPAMFQACSRHISGTFQAKVFGKGMHSG